jgi:uncharacterized protein
MILLDANIFIRFIIPDDPARAARCAKLLDSAAAGRERAVVTPMALAEVAWVLLGACRISKPNVIEALRKILNTAKLEIIDREILIRGLDLFENHGIDFIDAYHAAFMERRGIQTVCSYDTDFDQIPGITRKEP